MFTADLIVTIAVMSLLFLRHTVIYRDPGKINYMPIVLALGSGGSILHFVLYADAGNEIPILKESLLVLVLGILLSAIMSVLSRGASSSSRSENLSLVRSMGEEINLLKRAFEMSAQRLDIVAQMEDSTHAQLRTLFKEEIEALGAIQSNQKLFVAKIEALLTQQHAIMEKFEEFTLTEVPGLDNIIHRHIDLLRIAEQDHFNQLKTTLKASCDDQHGLADRLEKLDERLERIESQGLDEHTLSVLHRELNRIIAEFAHQVHAIASKSESIATALMENDARIQGSREQSELIMQQMVLSSKQMREITLQSKELSDTLKPLLPLLAAAEAIQGEFLRAKSTISELIVTLEAYAKQDHRAAREQLENLADEVREQLQLLSSSLEHYKPLALDTKNIQELSGKVRLYKSYVGENQE